MNQVETLKTLRRTCGDEVLTKENKHGNALHTACDAGDLAIDAIIFLIDEVQVFINSVDD